MRKKRKIESRYYIVIVFFAILIILGIWMYFVREKRNPSPIEQVLQDTFLFVQKIVSKPFHFVTDKIQESKDKNKIYEKYKELEQQVEQVQAITAKNAELESELQEMKSLLEFNQTLTESSYLNATVVMRNIDGWNQTITVDKGKKQGVKEDMAVVTRQGIIGYVLHTSQFNSTVKLLTSVDANHKVSVKIEGNEGYIYGLLSSYDTNTGYYKIEGIAENTEIKEGANVITTGLGNTFPAGILLGTVAQIQTDHFDLARTISVTPSVNFDEIRYVTILKK